MPYSIIIAAIIVLVYLFDALIEFLNDRARNDTIPAEIADVYNQEERSKQNAYQHENYRLNFIEELLVTMLIVVFIFTGVFGALDAWVRAISGNLIAETLLFFGVAFVAKLIFGLPFSYYQTFAIEARYGFNKSTRKTFWLDVLKSLIITAIIGGGVLALATLFYQKTGALFWLAGWALVSAVSLFFAVFYTTLIVPLFNKLTALPEGDLRQKIFAFAEANNFKVKNISVMNASLRSTKANAYFSGLGSSKTIVLFDTLIASQTTDELVAVLAHEIGHYQLKHARRKIVIGLLQTGVLFYLLSVFLRHGSFAHALSMQPSFYAGLLIFSFIFSPIFTLVNLATTALSRAHEFEADRYAKERNVAASLATALKKLTKNNYVSPTPHPLYVFFKYNHPTTTDRLKKLIS